MPAELTSDVPAGVAVRRDFSPADGAAVVAMHRRLYLDAYGLDEDFVRSVAASVERAVARGFPAAREGAWLVEGAGRLLGAVALTDEGDGEGRLRWVVLEPELRGAGLGRRLVSAAVGHARESGQSLLALETFADLRAAASIYRRLGFALVAEDSSPRWGREDIVYQRYELELSAG